MSISSNCLFHFTPEFKFLEEILRNGFWPRYCKEYGWGNQYIDFALPMVCFCDIPLYLIHEHTGFYGSFGIGVSAKWIRDNKDITPVQYISNTSHEFDSINRILTKLKNNAISESEMGKLLLAKKVSGMAINKNGEEGNKKFYNEREWRYVPTKVELEPLIVPIPKHNDINLSEFSKQTDKHRLKIQISDIRYLLIPNDSYRTRLIDAIRKIYIKENQDKIDILISRIITLKQIEDDF